MSLDFHFANDRQKSIVLYHLSLTEFIRLQPAFSEFKAQTGTDIDMYSNGRISSGHFQLLTEVVGQTDCAFREFLEGLELVDEDITFEGD